MHRQIPFESTKNRLVIRYTSRLIQSDSKLLFIFHPLAEAEHLSKFPASGTLCRNRMSEKMAPQGLVSRVEVQNGGIEVSR